MIPGSLAYVLKTPMMMTPVAMPGGWPMANPMLNTALDDNGITGDDSDSRDSNPINRFPFRNPITGNDHATSNDTGLFPCTNDYGNGVGTQWNGITGTTYSPSSTRYQSPDGVNRHDTGFQW